MANSIFAMCLFFAVCIVSTDGKEVLCRQPADGKELADDKFLDSSSVMRLFQGEMTTFQDLVSLVKCVKLHFESVMANPKSILFRLKHTSKNSSMI